MEPGLYLTFFTPGESFESELPPVGPLEHLVVRERSLVAERQSLDQGDAFGGGSRWIEAEIELQRAMGNEPGGARRPNLRVNAPNGVYLRFASFGDAPEPEPVPELGPYAVIIVSRESIEADGDLLATRTGTNPRLWELTSQGGTALSGLIRPDVAFRTKSTTYHPRIHSAGAKREAFAATQLRSSRAQQQPRAELPARPPADRESPTTRPIDTSLASAPSAPSKPEIPTRHLQPEADEVTLRTRLGIGTQTTQGSPVVTPSSSRLDRGGTASRLRLLIVGTLVLAAALLGAYALRSAFSGASANVVGIGKTVNGQRWAYAVIKVSRASEAGVARAHGTYLIVWVEMTNRGSGDARLLPTDFALVDPSGAQFSPLYQTDPAYRSDSNNTSPYNWISAFPVGTPISAPVIFDVDPGLRGMELVILEVPTVRVRLD